MSLIPFYLEVVNALNVEHVPYMIVGAFAATRYGLNRSTYAVDIIVDLQEVYIEPFVNHFPSPRYYADADQIREGMELRIMFNLIDSQRGAKADLVPLSREPEYRYAFARRIPRQFNDEEGNIFEAWCARPEDVIIGKLMAWNEGRSNKHPNDISAMLIFDFAGLSDMSIDLAYVTQALQE